MSLFRDFPGMQLSPRESVCATIIAARLEFFLVISGFDRARAWRLAMAATAAFLQSRARIGENEVCTFSLPGGELRLGGAAELCARGIANPISVDAVVEFAERDLGRLPQDACSDWERATHVLAGHIVSLHERVAGVVPEGGHA